MFEALRQPHLCEHRGGAGCGLGAFHAAYQQWHGNIFQRGEFRQQMMKLVYKTERVIAHLTALRLVHALHFLPEYLHAAAAGMIQSAEQMQQRALAGARRADDGDALTALHIKIDAFEHRHILFADGEGLG